MSGENQISICNKCVWSRRDGGCNSWDCKFIDQIDAANAYSGLPIIRCRDCKHVEHDELFHELWCMGREVKPDHYCGYAERRDNE